MNPMVREGRGRLRETGSAVPLATAAAWVSDGDPRPPLLPAALCRGWGGGSVKRHPAEWLLGESGQVALRWVADVVSRAPLSDHRRSSCA